MRLITGDECGLLKECIPERSSNPKNKPKNEFEDDDNNDHVAPHNAMPHVSLDGVRRIDSKEIQSRQRSIIDMTFTTEDRDQLSFATLRTDGSIQLWEGSTESKKHFGKYRKAYETGNIFGKNMNDDNTMVQTWKPLALGAFPKESRLCAGDSFGNLSIVNIKDGNIVQTYNAYTTSKGSQTISYTPGNKQNTQMATAMACDSVVHNWIAMGGRERDTTVIDLLTGKIIFKGKNLPPDPQTLLQHPVWPTGILFLEDGNTLAVGTAYKELRLYDIRESSMTRRPIARTTTEGGPIEYRVTSLCQIDPYEIAVGDAAGYIYSIDMRTLGKSNIDKMKNKNMGRYVGPAGSVRQLKKHPKLPRMAAVGLDRMLRIYDTRNRKQLDSFYLKQRLNCVLFGYDTDWRPDSNLEDDNEDDDHDDQDIDQDDVVKDYVDSDDEQQEQEDDNDSNEDDEEQESDASDDGENEESDEDNAASEHSDDDASPVHNEHRTSDDETEESDSDDEDDEEEEGDDDDDDEDSDEEIIIEAPKKKKHRKQ